MGKGRTELYKYDGRGLIRKNCERCGKYRASEQWSLTACAVGKTNWFAFCIFCDIEFNRDTLLFAGHPDTVQLLQAYIARKYIAYENFYTPEQWAEGLKCLTR